METAADEIEKVGGMVEKRGNVLAQVLDGRAIAAKLKDHLKQTVEQLRLKSGRTPFLLSVQVGTHAAADLFTRSQMKAAAHLGIGYQREL